MAVLTSDRSLLSSARLESLEHQRTATLETLADIDKRINEENERLAALPQDDYPVGTYLLVEEDSVKGRRQHVYAKVQEPGDPQPKWLVNGALTGWERMVGLFARGHVQAGTRIWRIDLMLDDTDHFKPEIRLLEPGHRLPDSLQAKEYSDLLELAKKFDIHLPLRLRQPPMRQQDLVANKSGVWPDLVANKSGVWPVRGSQTHEMLVDYILDALEDDDAEDEDWTE